MRKVRTPHRPQVLLQLILKPFRSYDLKGFIFFTIKFSLIREPKGDQVLIHVTNSYNLII